MNNQNIYGIVKSKPIIYNSKDNLLCFMLESNNGVRQVYISNTNYKLSGITVKTNQRVLVRGSIKNGMFFANSVELV